MFTPDEATTQLLKNNEPQPIPRQNLRVKTWFLQKDNGEIVAVDEVAAWHMMNPNHNSGFNAPKWKIVGTSYAQIYASVVEGLGNTPDMNEKKKLLKQAFEDELAEARKHPERPRNPNILDISGRAQTDPAVLGNMPR